MRIAITLFTCLLLVACGNLNIKPGEKPHARRDAPSGPGLLTGGLGEFVIFRVEDSAPEQKEETDQSDPKTMTKQ